MKYEMICYITDDVRSRLHGQLEIQPISGGQLPPNMGHHLPSQSLRPPSNIPPWMNHHPPTGRTPPPAHTTTGSKAFATSSSNDGTGTGSEGPHSDPDDPRNYRMHMTKRGRETPNNGMDNHWSDNNGRHETSRASPLTGPPPRSRSRPSSSNSATASASNAALLAAAQAAGMPLSALDPSDPMSSMNALLAAAQVSLTCELLYNPV